jgi:hypothetical protein
VDYEETNNQLAALQGLREKLVEEVRNHYEPPLTDQTDLERDLDTTIEELRAIRMKIHQIDQQISNLTLLSAMHIEPKA